MRVLVVEDEIRMAKLIKQGLEEDQYAVDMIHDGTEVFDWVHTADYDLIVLDIMLPGIDGLEVLRQIRQSSDVYVIMLTARADEADKVIGLGLGADDYVTKPFSPRELASKIR